MSVKIAVIGAGAIGRVHAQNVEAHPHAELIAICDTNRKAAAELSERRGGVAVVSIEEALRLEPDAVIIASSTSSHGAVAAACIAAQKPFLCEKPLASDLQSAERIAADASHAGIVAATAFNRRLDAGYAGIRNAVAAGEIGRIESILITSRTASPPTLEFARTSGGLFGEKGAHFYDLARWITGEDPISLFAMGSAIVNPKFAEIGEVDTAMITMKMPSGTLCNFDFSWRAAYGQDERLEVNGSLGMLRTSQEPVGRFLRTSASGEMRDGLMPTWYERFAPTYASELDLFLASVTSGEVKGLASLEDGCAAQRITDAARESARTSRMVEFA